MKAILRSLFFSFLTCLLTSCNSDSGSSHPGVTTNFAITGSGMNATVSTSWFMTKAYALTPPPLTDSNLANVDLFEAWIVVKHIHFFRSNNPDILSTAADHYKGPFVVNLLDPTPDFFGSLRLNPEGLRQVKMLLHKAHGHLPAGAPAELTGKSVYFRGQVNGFAFSYVSDDTTDFRIRGPRAVIPESGKNLLVTIRIADLFKKIDLSSITADTEISASNRVNAVDPCPLIHPGASNLYTCFRQGLNKEAKFGVDTGDDDLDDSETVN